jgi:tetratricopeptide (TPR) repeat protein
MAAMFAGTTVVAHWYRTERIARGQKYFELGSSLERRGDEAGAVEAYRNALSIARQNNQYRMALAEALIKAGHLDEAALYLHEILESNPADAESNLLLAQIAAREHEPADAVTYYHRAIYGYWKPGSAEMRLEARWALIGLLEKSGRRQQIVAELLQIPETAPDDLAAQKRAAALLLQYGSPGSAETLYQNVLRRTPGDAEAETGVGLAEMAQANYLNARSALRKAVRDNPGYEAAQKALALVTQVLLLDPMARGLSQTGMYSRSRLLVRRSAAALEACLANRSTPETGAGQALGAAQKQLASRLRGSPHAAAEANIATAEHLWDLRQNLCPTPSSDEALAGVMAKLEK